MSIIPSPPKYGVAKLDAQATTPLMGVSGFSTLSVDLPLLFRINKHPKYFAMDTLTPQDLFSPSKARQQRAQAADWAQIDSWLSYKYAGRTVPTFERNEETLKVLRELAGANERADEERMVAERMEREAGKELEESEV
jgi:hypothetical protein